MAIRLLPIISLGVGGFQGYNYKKNLENGDVYKYLGISTGFLTIVCMSIGSGLISSVLASSIVNGGFYGVGYFSGKIVSKVKEN